MCAGKRFLAGTSLCRAAKNVEGGNRCNGRLQTRCLQNRFQLACADDGVHLRNALLDFVAIALDQAASDNELTRAARKLVLRHLQNGVDRLLLGCVNEGAGVDDEDFSLFRMSGQPRAGAV